MNSPFEKLAGKRIAVVGDVMLDSYLEGRVERISPEAPVPIVAVSGERFVAGGAANVATNLASFGARVLLVGTVGNDVARDRLLQALAAHRSIEVDGLVAVRHRDTTCKLRIIGDHQQVVRVDREQREPLGSTDEAELIATALRSIEKADVVILSDYDKGVLSDAVLRAVIGAARDSRRPVIVDPKRRDFGAYRGATILTPNRKELAEATGIACETDDQAAAAATQAHARCGAHILLTRSDKGMSLFVKDAPPAHLATVAQDVFDVSGAGDTVVAALAAGIACELPLLECMRIANHAAGIVVSKRGTATVGPDELGRALATESFAASVEDGSLLDRAALVALRARWAGERLTVGLTNGCFDLLHPGHVALIRQAAASCDRLVVAVNSDESVRRLKGAGRPIQDERARAEVMGGLRGVAAVTLFAEDTPLKLIEAIQPDLLVKGADYTIGTVVGADVVQARGGRVLLVPLEPNRSTTALVAAAQ